VKRTLQYDYATVGHVTIDVLDDGTRQPGGAAFYSALQAARLGRRALIVTRGLAAELEPLLEPYSDELEVRIIAARATTTLATSGSGAGRIQRVLAWAGPIDFDQAPPCAVLHLAPVAREIGGDWRDAGAAFVGLTPQGLARRWTAAGARIELEPVTVEAARLGGRADAIVLSELERASCSALIATAGAGGGVVAVTAGERPTTLLVDGAAAATLAVPELADAVEDLGAGDVFAAAFFDELAHGSEPRAAARFATAAAAVRMAARGAGAIGDRAAIVARLARG